MIHREAVSHLVLVANTTDSVDRFDNAYYSFFYSNVSHYCTVIVFVLLSSIYTGTIFFTNLSRFF